MRARFVNEIKQNNKISGLGSIGIGSIGMCKAFEVCSTFNPKLKQILPMDSLYWKWESPLEKFPDKMSKILGVTKDRLVHIIEQELNEKSKDYLRNIFSDIRDIEEWPTSYIRRDEMQLRYIEAEPVDKVNDSTQYYYTDMIIYTNELLGVSVVIERDNLNNSMIRFFIFRTPEI